MSIQPMVQEQWPPGTEVVAMYNFKGNSNEDLPFSKRDVLTIVKPTRVCFSSCLRGSEYTHIMSIDREFIHMYLKPTLCPILFQRERKYSNTAIFTIKLVY